MRFQFALCLAVFMTLQTACTKKTGTLRPPAPPPVAFQPPDANQTIFTAVPIADYYVCRLTPQQSLVFTFQYDAYRQILIVVNRFVEAANRPSVPEIVYSYSPSDVKAMVAKLIAAGLVRPEKSDALTFQIQAINAMAASNAAVNVGCSQSLLTWNETRHMFGRAVADNYLAIQVNVRNLDADNEFLLHDSQVAFRNAPAGAGDTLFVGARDRVLARGLQQATTWDSRRNLSVLLASAVGSLGVAAAAITGGPSLRDAFSVFNGSFVPFLDGKVPDLSLAQLRLMDDVVYSSANAYHIVVPTKGTVPFVIFVPLDVYVGTAAQFKALDQNGLKALADRMFVIVAGVHIAQVNPAVSLAKLTCPTTAAGGLDLSNTPDAAKKQFVCEVTGTGLNQIAKIKLRNSKDSSDNVAPEAALSVDGGSTTSGKATFDATALGQLTGSQYTAFLVQANGQETSTPVTLNIAPAVDSVAFHLAACPAAAKCGIQISGRNLGLLDGVSLKIGGADTATALETGTPSNRAVSFTSPAAALTATSQISLTLTTGGKSVTAPAIVISQ